MVLFGSSWLELSAHWSRGRFPCAGQTVSSNTSTSLLSSAGLGPFRQQLPSTTCLGQSWASYSTTLSAAGISRGGQSTIVSLLACPDGVCPAAHARLDVLSAGLDCGVAISIIVIFFCVQYPLAGGIGQNTIQTWWGNIVPFNNADGRSVSYKALPESGHFG